MLEDFLPLVSKPARYINSEINAIHKDLSQVTSTVCLFFPDAYEVGMSHLGLRILYDILNKRDDVACERVFSPWLDYEERLRASGRTLTSLESNRPLAQFDIIGVTLQYELSYTNILVGLDLAGIPLNTRDRNNTHPLIIAGGPCAVNPEPLADHIDVFFIGEAEEAISEIVDLRQELPDRDRFFDAIAKREGFYVPSRGRSDVRRRYLRSIDSSPYPLRPMLPLMKPIHDRVTVEIARGCIRGCRFCQAGIIYRPFRERSADRIKDILHESLACTGYEELSLASLSSGDHSAIQPLITDLTRQYRDSRISISLPSLRVGTLTPEMIEAIAETRKTGFTLAPEAGTERLRRVINKPVSDRDLFDATETIFANGWSTLKLYFMIGLPTETDEDLDGIARLALELYAIGRRSSKRHVQLNISVSTFVPKPHTPFQWYGQIPLEETKRKHAYLNSRLRKKGISLKTHGAETSLLEGAFARGDRSLGRVIEEAVKHGCRFDGWSECFDFTQWMEAFKTCGLDAAALACRTYGLDDTLPWDHIRTGVTKEFLKKEYRKALAEDTTDNCRRECTHCGIGCIDGGTPTLGQAQPIKSAAPEIHADDKKDRPAPGGPGMRIRMKYAKLDRLRFLSHLDLMMLFQRAIMRANIPIAFSQGFNPHPKIAFGPALPVGIESLADYVDLETNGIIELHTMTADLQRALPDSITLLGSKIISKNVPSLSGSIGRYTYEVQVPEQHRGNISATIAEFLSRTSVIISKEDQQKEIRDCIISIAEESSAGPVQLTITLEDRERVKPRIQDVIEQLFSINKEQAVLFRIKRVSLQCSVQGRWVSPMDMSA